MVATQPAFAPHSFGGDGKHHTSTTGHRESVLSFIGVILLSCAGNSGAHNGGRHDFVVDSGSRIGAE